ncbi:unnamed protein product [Larinioides sclopetarius]|uniref:TRAF-type domain-containing protein n=1 Tax=Larinioides sclopetarius TaxID=280406 RepID=A0AAV2A212_9ARAC
MEEEVKYCKNCKRDISAKNYVIHTVHCERNIQLCERCSEPVPRSELEKHEEEFHSKVACSECGISVEKWKIEKHKEACTKKLVPCEYCELEVPLDNLSEHTAACGSRTEQCSNCNRHIMIKDLQQHPISCSRREPETMPCEYCDLQINLNEMMEHTVMCGTQTERCHLCKEHVMVQDRDAHFVTCGKKRQLRHKVSSPCEYCGKLFSPALLEDHVVICRSQNQKCEKCEDYIPLKNMEMHLNSCKKKRQLNPEFPCKYCGELYLSDFLKDHADECGTRIRKCEKCDQLIALKNMEMHSNVCKESVSKTHGNCPICHQSIAWMEMNVHCAICAQVNCVTNEYEYQNKINELALRKESEASRNEINDKKKSQLDDGQKRCPFCFENFPYNHFCQHLNVCTERPYNCDACLKAMPYRKKEEHKRSCPDRRTRTHANNFLDYMHHDQETDDNKELKKFKKCQFCGLRLTDVVFQDHLKECEHREEERVACLEKVPAKDMHDHKLLKCNFACITEKGKFNNDNNTHAESFPVPYKNFERMGYLEENIKTCPSCKCKIPEERFNNHLSLCCYGKTQCHFCGLKISKTSEHLHFQVCNKILQMVREDNNPPSKKKKGHIIKGKSISEYFTSWWNPSYKGKNFERKNTKQTSQEPYSWQSNRSQSYETDNMMPIHPPTGFNEVNELPCEFCNQMWPSELLIEHESGCRPDLVSFPKANDGNDCDEKFAAAAAATISQISCTPVLDASPKSIKEEGSEWKVSRKNQTKDWIGKRETLDWKEREIYAPQKQINVKDKFFFYPSQDTDDISKNQPSSFRKKRYPQIRESQEPSKTKPDPKQKDDLKKTEFTSFKFSTFGNDEEMENDSYPRRENDDVLSTDLEKYDETKKRDSYDLRALSAESSAIVDYPKSNFNREIKAIGSERTERKRILDSRKDVEVKQDFEEISMQKSITFDGNIKSEPSKFLETSAIRTFNLTMPTLWNTESTLSIDKTLGHPLKFFDDNYDNEAKDEALSNASENIDHRETNSSRQERDYDAKNNETFGNSFVESINNNQNEGNENDTKSERSNSDDTFYDADDGGTNYFDTVNDNFHSSNSTQEEKASHYDFDNLNFGSTNQKSNVNPSTIEGLNGDLRLEEEDLNLTDCDLDGYFQFLHKSIKQSDEATQRMIGEVEKLSAEVCRCGNTKCSCELLSLMQKESSPQACSSEDASSSKSTSESMDIEPLAVEPKTENQMKSKKSIEFSSKNKAEDENIDTDEAMKWKKVNSF